MQTDKADPWVNVRHQRHIDAIYAPFGINRESGKPYPPHPTQKRIDEWVSSVRAGRHGKPGIPVLYLQHGVDSGGTRGVLNPVLKCLFELPGIRVLIGRKDYNDLRLSVMETFFEVMPREMIAQKDEQEHRFVIHSKGGKGQVFFRELKDVKGLGSQEFAIIVVAEVHEIDLSSYRTLKQRCRQEGYPLMVLMEGNPPLPGHWLENLTNPESNDFDPDVETIILPSTENFAFMNPSYRASLEQMPAAWRRRYLLGETAALPSGSPVYPSYAESVHAGETRLVPGRPLLRGWDFGFRRAACIWAQLEDNGRLQVHKEWLAMETPEDQFIRGVIQRTNESFGQVMCRDFGDPAARNRDPHGVSTLQRLQSHGINMMFRQTTYGERIPLINKKFCEMVGGGKAAIRINKNCQVLNEALLGGYHYQELKEGQPLGASKEVPFKDGYYDHVADAFSYLMVNVFGQNIDALRVRAAQRRMHEREITSTQGAAVF